MRRAALLAAVALLATACGTTAPHQHAGAALAPSPSSAAPAPSDDRARSVTYRCGIERWAVKTGTDPAASKIDLHTTVPSTVAALTALPVPAGFSQDAGRLPPVETTVYQVKATLTGFKMEADSDYHLILADGGKTMIAEVPDPGCVGISSPLLPGITAARAQFNAKYHPSDVFQQVTVPVTVTGVGFYDTIHGQAGVAPNGIELHPVLGIQFGSGG